LLSSTKPESILKSKRSASVPKKNTDLLTIAEKSEQVKEEKKVIIKRKKKS